MKAIVCTRYGPPEVLEMKEIPKPKPKPNEVRIRIKATGVTSGDVRIRRFDVPISFWIPARFALGITKPRYAVLGIVSSGEIDSVGSGVCRFKPGDQVFAATDFDRFGAYAEYLCIKETGSIALKPEKMNYEEAASIIFGGLTAIDFLRRAGLKKGQKILIYGASGSVGTSSVQLAKHYGAVVTAVCSGVNTEMVRALGADHVIDYLKDDFSQQGVLYDVVFDAVAKAPFSACLRALKKGGIYLNAVDTPGLMMRMRWASWTRGIRLRDKSNTKKSSKISSEDFFMLKTLADEGAIRPVIDRVYSLNEIVEAHRYVQQGHKKGNVAVSIGAP